VKVLQQIQGFSFGNLKSFFSLRLADKSELPAKCVTFPIWRHPFLAMQAITGSSEAIETPPVFLALVSPCGVSPHRFIHAVMVVVFDGFESVRGVGAPPRGLVCPPSAFPDME